jgi:phage terminase small subunit
MARGRRAVPDEVKAMRGNPGKRRLALEARDRKRDEPRLAVLPAEQVTVPEFLTGERERVIFGRVVGDYLQRRIARRPDLTAYARWAHYLDRWIGCKEALEGKPTFFKSESRHGTLLRRHPLWKDQLDIERVLQSLEDRLGLNPVARQNIMRGLAALPPALGDLFGDERPKPADPEAAAPEAPDVDEAAQRDPLGYVEHRGKLN